MNNRKWIMAAVSMLTLLLSVAIPEAGTPVAVAQGGFQDAVFDIVPDGAGLAALPATGSTFLITGKIYPFKTVNQADCSGIVASIPFLGIWRAWGEAAEDGRVVMHQSLQLTAFNGVIELQGTSGLLVATGGATPAAAPSPNFIGPSEVISVVGGSGTFRSAAGEAQIRPYCQTQSDTTRPFRYDRAFCISLVETPRRGNR